MTSIVEHEINCCLQEYQETSVELKKIAKLVVDFGSSILTPKSISQYILVSDESFDLERKYHEKKFLISQDIFLTTKQCLSETLLTGKEIKV